MKSRSPSPRNRNKNKSVALLPVETQKVSQHAESTWCSQFRALTLKNLYVMWSAKLTLLAYFIVIPVASVLMMNSVQALFLGIVHRHTGVGAPMKEMKLGDAFPLCIVFSYEQKEPTDASCVNLLLAPKDASDMAAAKVVENKLRDTFPDREFKLANNRADLLSMLMKYPGTYDAAATISGTTVDQFFSNSTSDELYATKKGDYYHSAQIYQALQKAVNPNSGKEKDLSLKPLSNDIVSAVKKGQEINDYFEKTYMSDLLHFFLMPVVLLLSVISVTSLSFINREHHDGQVGLLRTTGLRESAYLSSWCLVLFSMYIIVALAFVGAGCAFGILVFKQANFFILVFSTWSYLVSLTSLLLLFASFIHNQRAMQAIQFLILVGMTASQIIIGMIYWQSRKDEKKPDSYDNSVSFHHLWDKGNKSAWFLVPFLPNIAFTTIVQSFYLVTGCDFRDSDGKAWIIAYDTEDTTDKGEPKMKWYSPDDDNKHLVFGFDDFFKQIGKSGNAHVKSDELIYPSGGEMILAFWLSTIVFLFIAWYVAKLMRGEPFNFFITFFTQHKAPEESLHLDQLSKTFGGEVNVVSDLSLSIDKRQVICLLGRNGAGKSTTINMITGNTKPSRGDATVCGYDIRTEMKQIQNVLSLCPQHDVLFTKLTGYQNMMIIALFRGVKNRREEIQELLEGVNLLSAQHQKVDSYSGGMQRRLSLAISAIGKRRIIILDEPTTGVDPYTRRFVWDTIRKMKEDSIVVMTTHNLEEADYLSDNIAILAHGSLVAQGQSLELKNEYGNGFQLHLNVDSAKRESMRKKMGEWLPTIETLINTGTNLTFGVPASPSLPALFRRLETEVSKNNISSWSISQTSLEDAFLTLVGKEDTEESQEEFETYEDIEVVAHSTMWSQLRGLFYKSLTTQWRRRKSNIMNLVILFLLLTVFVVVKYTMKPEETDAKSTRCKGETGDYDVVDFPDCRKAFEQGQPSKLLSNLQNYYFYYGKYRSGRNLDIWHDGKLSAPLPAGLNAYWQSIKQITGIEAEIENRRNKLKRWTREPTPTKSWWLPAEMPKQPAQDDTDAYSFYPAHMIKSTSDGTTIFLLPPRKDRPHSYFEEFFFTSNIEDENRHNIVYALLPTEFKMILLFQLIIATDPVELQYTMKKFMTPNAIDLPIVRMPELKFQGENPIKKDWKIMLLVGVLTPLIAMMSLPNSVSEVALEHREKCVFLMRAHSMRSFPYWLNVCGVSYLMYLVVMICYTAVVAPLFFPEGFDYGCYAFVVLLWGTTLSGLAVFFGGVFANSQSVTLIVLVYMVGMSVQCLMNAFAAWLPWTYFVPPLPFIRALFILFGIAKDDGAFWNCVIALPVLTIVTFTIGVLAASLAGDEMSPLKQALERWTTRRMRKRSGSVAINPNEDEDVRMERERVANADDLVRLENANKQYGKKTAVANLTFGVKRGECMGLLGGNGAGKTTTVSVMSGTNMLTSGSVTINGVSISDDRKEAMRIVGLCPQFDYVYPELTVTENLLLFARLKGVNVSEEKAVCARICALVGLSAEQGKRAGHLSGGMRRRLVIAIAMLVLPDVILLDEPSTGTDPKTRVQLWGTLQRLKKGRAMLLTTHRMDEAEALSDRVGIMMHGELQCLGKPLHLREKFGMGYVLQVRTTMLDEVIEFVTKLMKDLDAKAPHVLRILDDFVELALPDGRRLLPTLFEKLEDNKSQMNILDWSAGQSSLDDVFISIAKAASQPNVVVEKSI